MAAYFGSNSKNQICVVCKPRHSSEFPIIPIYHKHHSTAFFFEKMLSKNKMADCPTCMEIHPPANHGRIRILSTSSTLHNAQFTETFPSELDKTMTELGLSHGSFHIDVDSIPGGRIHNLSYSWLINYSKQPLPCDVFVVAGLNDIKDQTADEIMDRLERWRTLVSEHSFKNNHEFPSTFAVSPILNAPKYYWHPSNPFSPPLGYTNYKAMMDEVNERIYRFNIANNVPKAVTLHTMGDRRVRGKSMTKWSSWREFHREVPAGQEILPRSIADISPLDNKAYHDCLHLTDPLRVKCYMKILKYFYHNTKHE